MTDSDSDRGRDVEEEALRVQVRNRDSNVVWWRCCADCGLLSLAGTNESKSYC